MAIKLTSKNKERNESFYFNTMEDYEIFKEVFKDHWCNVEWEDPVKVDCIPDDNYINKDPHQRALDNLSWEFNATWKNDNDRQVITFSIFIY